MKVRYDEDTNSIVLEFKEGVSIQLPANHETLGLWKKIGIPKYQKWLWEQQGHRCADCGKDLPEPRKHGISYLHHDPPLGSKGSKVVDYKKTTQNRVLCYDCHKRYHQKAKENLMTR